MAKRPYGKVCRRDVTAIRRILKTRMRDFAKEWAELHPGEGAASWWSFLSEKLKSEVKSIPVTCG